MRALYIALIASVFLAACGSNAPPTQTSQRPPAAEPPKPADPRTRARIRTELAAAYYESGNMAVAVEEIRNALAADPTYATAHSINALIQMELREPAQAQASFQRALQLEPNDPDINHNYGWYLCQNGREADSLKYFAAAIRDPLYQTPARSYSTSGACLQKLNRTVEAMNQFEAALRLDPNFTPAMLPLARIRFERGDLDVARALTTRLNDGAAVTAGSLWLGILIERRRGNSTNADGLGAQLTRRFPDSPEALRFKEGRFE